MDKDTIEKKIESLIEGDDKTALEQNPEVVDVVEDTLKVDVSADVAALVEGEELSEEFKAKAATIFESAVISKVKQEIVKLEEKFDARLAEAVQAEKQGLVEQIDGYLSYVAEEWMKQNEIALERGMKSEILESFVTGLKGLFAEHYIDVPEEKLDLLGTLETANADLEAKLNEQVAKNVELNKTLVESQRKEIVNSLVEGLTDTDAEKLRSLAEDLSFESAEAFETKVKTIRESYFTKHNPKVNLKSVVSDTPLDDIKEEVIDPSIRQYLTTINTLNKGK